MIDTKTQPSLLFLLILFSLFLIATGMVGCTSHRKVVIEQQPSIDLNAFSHDYFDKVLQKYANDDGLVDYLALQADPRDLDAYYYLLANYSPDSHPEFFPSDNHKLAYWINGYNAGAMIAVLAYYPIDSVIEVKTPAPFFFLTDKAGFFFFQRLSFGGKATSLYYLENSVIRKRFEDPRIHFAVNCASIGCPRLPRTSFSGEILDRQLDHETRRFLAEERNLRIDHAEKTVYLSQIFQWYEDDFIDWYSKEFPGRTASLLSYVQLYLPPEKAEALEGVSSEYSVHFTPYDWHLNDQN